MTPEDRAILRKLWSILMQALYSHDSINECDAEGLALLADPPPPDEAEMKRRREAFPYPDLTK